MNRLITAVTRSEPATHAQLRMLGYGVEGYGQSILTPQAREMLRGVPTPQRWMPDFIVTRNPIVEQPRWPPTRREKYTFLADAKYANDRTPNHSIEMRSLLAAPTFGLDVYYVCSFRSGDEFHDFGVIPSDWVLPAMVKPCCTHCHKIFRESKQAMLELPEYCPNQKRNSDASGTPYVVFPAKDLQPLTVYVFDNFAMATKGVAGDLVQS